MHAVSSNSCSVLRLARGTGPTRSNIRAATSFKFRFSPALCASPKIGRTCSVVSGQPFSAVNEVATVQRAVSCSSSFLGERKILQRSRMVSPKASNAHVRPFSLRAAGDSLPSLERMSQLRRSVQHLHQPYHGCNQDAKSSFCSFELGSQNPLV